MHIKSTLALSLILSSPLYAEPTTAIIPGRPWVLKYDIGQISEYMARISDKQFQYEASTLPSKNEPRVILSFFLEKEATDSKESCQNTFWGRASLNPLIDKKTIKHTSHEKYEEVIYKFKTGHPNANYYFVNDGYCADIHISLSTETPQSEDILIGYGKTLSW